ncbi:MAG: hypothetical protein H8E27_11395 [Verrucomicrobia subdivision 3 bacterium]|nr:hypothetical protein [Limisphaerales bacterium]
MATGSAFGEIIKEPLVIQNSGPVVLYGQLFEAPNPNYPISGAGVRSNALNYLENYFAIGQPARRTQPSFFIDLRFRKVKKQPGPKLWMPKGFVEGYLAPRLVYIINELPLSKFAAAHLFYYLHPYGDMTPWLVELLEDKDGQIVNAAIRNLTYASLVHGRKYPREKVMEKVFQFMEGENPYDGNYLLWRIHDIGPNREKLIAVLIQKQNKFAQEEKEKKRLGDRHSIENTIRLLQNGGLPRKFVVLPERLKINPALTPGPHHPKPNWLTLKPVKDLLPGENPVKFLKPIPRSPASTIPGRIPQSRQNRSVIPGTVPRFIRPTNPRIPNLFLPGYGAFARPTNEWNPASTPHSRIRVRPLPHAKTKTSVNCSPGRWPGSRPTGPGYIRAADLFGFFFS